MKKIEYVDIYDRNKNKTGKIKIRNIDSYEDGEYIIGVQLVIFNNNNEILITKRSNTKKVLPGKWECNGGAIDSGETSIQGLEREIREELGIILNINKVKLFKTVINEEEHVIKDIYLYRENYDISSLEFTDNEVSDAKFVSINKYMDMFNSGEIVYNINFDDKDYMEAIRLI